jgi:hypothetical protein
MHKLWQVKFMTQKNQGIVVLKRTKGKLIGAMKVFLVNGGLG